MIMQKNLLLGAFVVVALIAVVWSFYFSPQLQKCGIEQCHGLEITCGPNIPSVCTEIYQLGDRCINFVSCEVIDGTCQLANSEKFFQCKSCFETCAQESKGNPQAVEKCDIECAA